LISDFQQLESYADWFDAVFTYKINKNDVGIIINKAVAVSPKMLTSMIVKYVSIRNNFYLQVNVLTPNKKEKKLHESSKYLTL